MLVFQLNLDHLEERCASRAGRDLKWLLEVVAEINLYLPDDWRMTRSSNNFRIQVVGKDTPALVGHSYRTDGDEILHVIDSVFEKGFIDQYDLNAQYNPGGTNAGVSDPRRSRFDAGTKCRNPECVAPNLYFFRPCPDDSSTPLFARQYEKVFVNKDKEPIGTQYHRIHPLSRAGLDLHHFRWIRWNITGHAELVDTPEPEYRGKDYWETPLLENEANRASFEIYMINYGRTMRRHGVSLPKPPDTYTSPYEYEHEYKFLIEGSEEDARETFTLIREEAAAGGAFFQETGFSVREESQRRSRRQVDLYFDDNQLALCESGVSFRLREKKDLMRVTLKKRLPAPMRIPEQEGLYERIEEEAIVTRPQKKALLEGKRINVFPCRLIAYVVPQCGILWPKLKVVNKRQVLILEDADHRKVEMCLDEVTYEPPRGKSTVPPPLRAHFEIEIEGKGAPRESVRRLARHLEKNLKLKPSPDTKYQRGISLLVGQGLCRQAQQQSNDESESMEGSLAGK